MDYFIHLGEIESKKQKLRFFLTLFFYMYV